MTVTLWLPATEVISIDAMVSVDTVVWRCRLCDRHGTVTTRPAAHSEGVEHLSAEHHATISRGGWNRTARSHLTTMVTRRSAPGRDPDRVLVRDLLA